MAKNATYMVEATIATISNVSVSGGDPISFLHPNEATDRINKITSLLENSLRDQDGTKFTASVIYRMALMAQAKVLGYLNDDSIFCKVLWDQRTNMPSHPSLAADAGKYGDLFRSSSELKSILGSLSGWATLKREKISCCCGRKERLVDLEIMLNTIMKAENGLLSVKVLVGIKTDDNDHLEKHYNLKKQSCVDGGLYIIFTCENSVRLEGEEIKIEPLVLSHAEQFNVPEFEKQIRKLADQIAES